MIEIKQKNGSVDLIFKEECRIFEIEEDIEKIKNALNKGKKAKKINIAIAEDAELDTAYFQLILSILNSEYEVIVNESSILRELKLLYGIENAF
ncbi:hypothetical protein [Thermodesulfovibrio hydrogeniphilus]